MALLLDEMQDTADPRARHGEVPAGVQRHRTCAGLAATTHTGWTRQGALVGGDTSPSRCARSPGVRGVGPLWTWPRSACLTLGSRPWPPIAPRGRVCILTSILDWSPHDYACAVGRVDAAAHQPPPPSAPGGRTAARPSRRRVTAARPRPAPVRGRADMCDPRPPPACPERPYHHHPTAGKVPLNGNAPDPDGSARVPTPTVPAAYE